jgi:hypothetical protein
MPSAVVQLSPLHPLPAFPPLPAVDQFPSCIQRVWFPITVFIIETK